MVSLSADQLNSECEEGLREVRILLLGQKDYETDQDSERVIKKLLSIKGFRYIGTKESRGRWHEKIKQIQKDLKGEAGDLGDYEKQYEEIVAFDENHLGHNFVKDFSLKKFAVKLKPHLSHDDKKVVFDKLNEYVFTPGGKLSEFMSYNVRALINRLSADARYPQTK